MSGEAPTPTEWDRIMLVRLAQERDEDRAEVERLRNEIAGLTVDLEDQRAITRSTFYDLNHTLDTVRDALTHIDAGEYGIARRQLQAVLEEVPR